MQAIFNQAPSLVQLPDGKLSVVFGVEFQIFAAPGDTLYFPGFGNITGSGISVNLQPVLGTTLQKFGAIRSITFSVGFNDTPPIAGQSELTYGPFVFYSDANLIAINSDKFEFNFVGGGNGFSRPERSIVTGSIPFISPVTSSVTLFKQIDAVSLAIAPNLGFGFFAFNNFDVQPFIIK